MILWLSREKTFLLCYTHDEINVTDKTFIALTFYLCMWKARRNLFFFLSQHLTTIMSSHL